MPSEIPIKKIGMNLQVSKEYLETLRQERVQLSSLMGPHRMGHCSDKVDPGEQAAFEHWKAEYERLREMGIDRDWLYEGYEGDEIEQPKGEWVWDETEEHFEKRRDEWLKRFKPNGDFITIPIVRRDGGDEDHGQA